ncbi:hypothetical protein V9T40_008570 [Parthenolecanium corni]|uniref:Uncharacterized protein n=1 Tax=Parthenolecanium corni TaxID=536013 RepID=A0AAN9Y7A1_9HEMI
MPKNSATSWIVCGLPLNKKFVVVEDTKSPLMYYVVPTSWVNIKNKIVHYPEPGNDIVSLVKSSAPVDPIWPMYNLAKVYLKSGNNPILISSLINIVLIECTTVLILYVIFSDSYDVAYKHVDTLVANKNDVGYTPSDIERLRIAQEDSAAAAKVAKAKAAKASKDARDAAAKKANDAATKKAGDAAAKLALDAASKLTYTPAANTDHTKPRGRKRKIPLEKTSTPFRHNKGGKEPRHVLPTTGRQDDDDVFIPSKSYKRTPLSEDIESEIESDEVERSIRGNSSDEYQFDSEEERRREHEQRQRQLEEEMRQYEEQRQLEEEQRRYEEQRQYEYTQSVTYTPTKRKSSRSASVTSNQLSPHSPVYTSRMLFGEPGNTPIGVHHLATFFTKMSNRFDDLTKQFKNVSSRLKNLENKYETDHIKMAKVMRIYKARQMVAELNNTATSTSTTGEQAAADQSLPTFADIMKDMTNEEEMQMMGEFNPRIILQWIAMFG